MPQKKYALDWWANLFHKRLSEVDELYYLID